MSTTWNGESRGCGDVMITRIRTLMRKKGVSGKIINKDNPFAYNEHDFYKEFSKIIATLEQNDLNLCDVLENVYIGLKES